ncbi:MAG: SMC-Scp complex subunit ScpB [Actinomycetales bacterium]|nr:SMC-Scp complex subunit ScpB [Actinomycetales bacterium]
MSEPHSELEDEPQDDSEPGSTPADESAADEGAAEQVAFDINDFPGGARSAIEAVLMVIDEPVEDTVLASALELPVEDVTAILEELSTEYAESERGFMLRRLGGRWRIYTKPAYAPVVEKFLMGGQQARLTQASLETLAVIAYRQPISRARVSAVRGVNVDGVVRTLISRGLIQEVVVDGEPGAAALYGTTDLFLQRMGLDSLDDLPELAPYLPSADIIEELAAEGHA